MEEWRQMGAMAAYWEVGKPAVSLAAMVVGVLLWRVRPSGERRSDVSHDR